MTTQVLCVTDNHSPSSPYYPLESTVFSSGSDVENDESSESILDSSLNVTSDEDQKQELEEQNILEESNLLQEEFAPKEDKQTKKSQLRCDFRNCLMVTSRRISYVTIGILGCAAQSGIGLLDVIISLCMNRGVRNVFMVMLTVAGEVFVIMVFAVATIFATIIINIDDAYRGRRETRLGVKDGKVRHTPSGCLEGASTSVKVKASKRRASKREKISHRSSKSSILNVRVLENDETAPEIGAFSPERTSTTSINKNLVPPERCPPSEGFDNDTETKNSEPDVNNLLKYVEPIIPEEVHVTETCQNDSSVCGDTDEEAKGEKTAARVSPPVEDTDNRVTNKQNTIYRNKLLTIQDTTAPKKINHRAPKSTQLFMGRDFDDGTENKACSKDEAVAIPNEGSSNDREIKDRTNKSSSITLNSSPTSVYYNMETASVSATQLAMSDCSEVENSNGDTLSFVSTKRIFETNSKS